MTIQADPSQVVYAGDGSTVEFEIPFPFDTSADIKVILTDADGTPELLSTGYSITGGNGSTGTLTMDEAPESDESLTVLDDPELTQPADYTTNDSFPADAHEAALDRTVRQVKRLNQRVNRSLRMRDGDTSDGDDLLIPLEAARAGKYLAFDAQGNPTASEGTAGADDALRTDLASTADSSDGSRLVGYRRSGASAGRTAHAKHSEIITPLDFGAVADGGTDDSAAFNAMFSEFVDGARILIPRGNYHFGSPVALGAFRGKVDAHGATFTWDHAGPCFTGFSAVGGFEFEGGIIDQTDNPDATFGFDMAYAVRCALRRIVFVSPGTAADYYGVRMRNLTAADPATGSLWNRVEQCTFYGTNDDFPGGILLQGTANATSIKGNDFAGVLNPILLQNEVGQNTIPEGVLIDDNFFEVYDTAIHVDNRGSVANTPFNGARIRGNRYENGTTMHSFTGMTVASSEPTEINGSYIVSNAGTYINNPTGLAYIDADDVSITPSISPSRLAQYFKRNAISGDHEFLAATTKGIALKNGLDALIASLIVRTGGGGLLSGVASDLYLEHIGTISFGSSTGVRIFSGSGTPEGVVTAPPGSLYLNSAGGAGTALYAKESGSGNTGWVAR